MNRNRMSLIAAGFALIAAACGGGGDEAAAGTGESAATTTSVIASTTTTEATTTTEGTTTSTTTTTTTTAAPGCASTPLPEAAEVAESYDLDVDADGASDTVTVYFDSSTGPGDFGSYGLFVEYASGGSSLLQRPVYAGRQPIVPIGLYDVQEDGTDELFVLEFLEEDGISYEPGVFNDIFVAEVDDCALTLGGDAARPDSEFGALFTIGAYPPQGVHLACEEGRLLRYDYFSESGGDSSAFSVQISPYAYVDGSWDLLVTDSETRAIPKDEMLARPLLDCGDLELPAPRPPG